MYSVRLKVQECTSDLVESLLARGVQILLSQLHYNFRDNQISHFLGNSSMNQLTYAAQS